MLKLCVTNVAIHFTEDLYKIRLSIWFKCLPIDDKQWSIISAHQT